LIAAAWVGPPSARKPSSAARTKIANNNRFMVTLPRTSAWHPSYPQPRAWAREEGHQQDEQGLDDEPAFHADLPYRAHRLLA
jgi:hypothetical protein